MAFPETDPVLDLATFIYWRTKDMDVIRHDQITTYQPRISFVPRRNKRVMHIRIGETLRPVSAQTVRKTIVGWPRKMKTPSAG